MSRPIGKNIPAACAIVERLGPCDWRDVARDMDWVDPAQARRYCNRAVSHGLMTLGELGYEAVLNWRNLADEIGRSQKPKEARRVAEPFYIPKINSVWALGIGA